MARMIPTAVMIFKTPGHTAVPTPSGAVRADRHRALHGHPAAPEPLETDTRIRHRVSRYPVSLSDRHRGFARPHHRLASAVAAGTHGAGLQRTPQTKPTQKPQ